MSTTVTIPTTEEHRTLTVAGFNLVTDLLPVDDYLYAVTSQSPAKLIRIKQDDFSDYTVATFASDGNHDQATSLVHAPSKDRLYVTFIKTGRLTVTEVNPDTITSQTDVISEASASAEQHDLETDDTYLYVILAAASNVISLWRYHLSNFAKATIDVSAYRGSSTIVAAGSKLYFAGWLAADTSQLKMIEVDGFNLSITRTANFPAGVSSTTAPRLHHLVALPSHLIFCTEEFSGTLWRFKLSDLSVASITGRPADHVGLAFDGVYTWNLLANGEAIRIDSELNQATYTLNSGEGYISELAAVGQTLYVSFFGTPTKIASYRVIPYGAFQWVQTVATSSQDTVCAVISDPDDNILAAGVTADQIFINKYSTAGSLIWSKIYGSGEARGIACDDSGNIYVIGFFMGAANFGGGQIPGSGYNDIFVIKLDPNGTLLWQKGFVGSGDDAGYAIACDAIGNPVITGMFTTALDLGNAILTTNGEEDVFLAKLSSADGSGIWSKSFGSSNADKGLAVAVDPSNNIILCGQFAISIDFGGGVLSGSGFEAFVAKFDSSGNHLWSKRHGGSLLDSANACACFSNGDIVVGGTFMQSADFGFGVAGSSGLRDMWLVKYSSNGTPLWAKTYGGSYQISDDLLGLAVDRNNNVLVAGMFTGSMDVGGPGPLVSVSGNDTLILKLTSAGSFVWAKTFGNNSNDRAFSIAADSSNNVLVAGGFARLVNFGNNNWHESLGGSDGFVLKLAA